MSSHYEKLDGIERCIDDEIPFELPQTWCWAMLSSLSTKITDGEHKTPTRVQDFCGYYLLSARNVRDGYLQLDDVDYVDEKEFVRISQRCHPQKGDIVISCSGSVGRCTMIHDANNYVMVRSAAMVSPIQMVSAYLMYAIQSDAVQLQIRNKTKQTAQANLFQEAIRNLFIPVPPISEQCRIISKISELMNICSKM